MKRIPLFVALLALGMVSGPDKPVESRSLYAANDR
jgi:hypothetical protein